MTAHFPLSTLPQLLELSVIKNLKVDESLKLLQVNRKFRGCLLFHGPLPRKIEKLEIWMGISSLSNENQIFCQEIYMLIQEKLTDSNDSLITSFHAFNTNQNSLLHLNSQAYLHTNGICDCEKSHEKFHIINKYSSQLFRRISTCRKLSIYTFSPKHPIESSEDPLLEVERFFPKCRFTQYFTLVSSSKTRTDVKRSFVCEFHHISTERLVFETCGEGSLESFDSYAEHYLPEVFESQWKRCKKFDCSGFALPLIHRILPTKPRIRLGVKNWDDFQDSIEYLLRERLSFPLSLYDLSTSDKGFEDVVTIFCRHHFLVIKELFNDDGDQIEVHLGRSADMANRLEPGGVSQGQIVKLCSIAFPHDNKDNLVY